MPARMDRIASLPNRRTRICLRDTQKGFPRAPGYDIGLRRTETLLPVGLNQVPRAPVWQEPDRGAGCSVVVREEIKKGTRYS